LTEPQESSFTRVAFAAALGALALAAGLHAVPVVLTAFAGATGLAFAAIWRVGQRRKAAEPGAARDIVT
jgi:hypothetical protein